MLTSVLALIGDLTIMYFAICVEEKIMQVLTGKGVVGVLLDYCNEIKDWYLKRRKKK